MASVDDLCRSYLDLKYHFDPSAASSAGLVSHDARLGRFDAETAQAHLVGTSRRSPTRSRSWSPTSCRPRSTAPRCWARSAARSSGWSTSGPTSAIRPSGSPICSRVSTPSWPAANGAAGGRAPAALERLRAIPEFLDAARDTLDEPPSVFVETALGMLGGGGELVVQLVAALDGDVPEMRDELRQAGQQALEALKSFGAALRDEIEPARRSPRLRGRRGAVQPPAPSRARAGVRRARALALRAAPAGGDRGRARRGGRAGWGGPGARWWRSSAATRPSPTPCSASTGPSWIGRTRSWTERDLVSIPREPVEVVPTPAFMLGLVPVRRVRAAADLPLASDRPVLRHAARYLAAARDGGAPAPGPLPARDPGHGGARGVSRAPPAAGHRAGARPPRCAGTCGRR